MSDERITEAYPGAAASLEEAQQADIHARTKFFETMTEVKPAPDFQYRPIDHATPTEACVRVAMGPIIGAILLANLITGVVGSALYYICTH